MRNTGVRNPSMSPVRARAIRDGRLVPHPIPTRLVKTADGSWINWPWFVFGDDPYVDQGRG